MGVDADGYDPLILITIVLAGDLIQNKTAE
jgi:hypothetical protein